MVLFQIHGSIFYCHIVIFIHVGSQASFHFQIHHCDLYHHYHHCYDDDHHHCHDDDDHDTNDDDDHDCVTNSAGIIGVTGSEQEDLKRCQEAIQLTWLLVSGDHDDQDNFSSLYVDFKHKLSSKAIWYLQISIFARLYG